MNAPDRPQASRPIATGPSVYSLALNALPFAHALAGVLAVVQAGSIGTAALIAGGWVYLLPPLLARIVLAIGDPPEGIDLPQSSRAYRVWWFLQQTQVMFNRFPALEEALRLVPGLYPLWLALWGARVSPKVYWGPGSMVLDRSLISIGSGVVIGTRAVLSAHLATKDADGGFRVSIAPIVIGDSVLVGAYAGIGPGCHIAAGSEVPAGMLVRPHTRWEGHRRVRSAVGSPP